MLFISAHVKIKIVSHTVFIPFPSTENYRIKIQHNNVRRNLQSIRRSLYSRKAACGSQELQGALDAGNVSLGVIRGDRRRIRRWLLSTPRWAGELWHLALEGNEAYQVAILQEKDPGREILQSKYAGLEDFLFERESQDR